MSNPSANAWDSPRENLLSLLPEPREMTLTGGEVSTSGLAVRKVLDQAAVKLEGDEAYHLEIKEQ
ncbi:MAG: hypothetical protein JW808_02885 [Victivallales bacterium]|nr:hypothetical protein [Victivallales bacterium]